MNLKNPFPNWVRVLFMDHQWCMVCESNKIPELHHIAGRISNSPYNGIVLCHDCHARVGHTEHEEQKFFRISLSFHTKNGYIPNQDDNDFVMSYKRLYNIIHEKKS